MKQHIIVSKKLDEVSGSGLSKLSVWAGDKGYKTKWSPSVAMELPLTLSIGQMIEFLGEYWWINLFTTATPFYEGMIEQSYKGELRDALWSDVKEELEE